MKSERETEEISAAKSARNLTPSTGETLSTPGKINRRVCEIEAREIEERKSKKHVKANANWKFLWAYDTYEFAG